MGERMVGSLFSGFVRFPNDYFPRLGTATLSAETPWPSAEQNKKSSVEFASGQSVLKVATLSAQTLYTVQFIARSQMPEAGSFLVFKQSFPRLGTATLSAETPWPSAEKQM